MIVLYCHLFVFAAASFASADIEAGEWISIYNKIFTPSETKMNPEETLNLLKYLRTERPSDLKDPNLYEKMDQVKMFANLAKPSDCMQIELVKFKFDFPEHLYADKIQNTNAIDFFNITKQRQWTKCEKEIADEIKLVGEGEGVDGESDLKKMARKVRSLQPKGSISVDILSLAIAEYLRDKDVRPTDNESFSFKFRSFVYKPCHVIEITHVDNIDKVYSEILNNVSADQLSSPEVMDHVYLIKTCRMIRDSPSLIEQKSLKHLHSYLKRAPKLDLMGKIRTMLSTN